MKFTKIKETCIYVKDLEQTRHFYEDLLGLQLISLVKERHVFFKAGQSVLLCFIAEETLLQEELPPHGATGIIHFAFEVEAGDYESALKHVKSCGIKVLYEQLWKNNLKSFYFSDPDKNLLEIIQEGLWDL